MRKGRMSIVLTLMVGAMMLSACGHEHTWEEATCTEPKTCSECGETEGEALGHTWKEATCTEAKTCSVCGETEGEALGHTWVEATCTTPKTCSVCGATEGEALGHQVSEWETTEEASCSEEGTEQGTCETCNETITRAIDKVEHTPGDWEVTEEATSGKEGTQTKYCTVCGQVLESQNYTLTDEEIKEAYKEKCESYSYDTIARDPDNYKYTYAKYTGEVIQVLEDGNDLQMRVNVTKGKYSYTDTIYVLYTRKEGESRILEDDIVTLYGLNAGTVSYETVLGATVTIPAVYAEYLELN